MLTNIFISYRHSDSKPFCNALSEELSRQFNYLNIFLDEKKNDEDSLPIGSPIGSNIEQALQSANIILVVIGSHWLVENRPGIPRVTEENDWVRKEIRCALKYSRKDPKVKVIPILVGDEKQIRELILDARLPEDLHPLREIRAANFPIDFPNDEDLEKLDVQASIKSKTEALVREIKTIMKEPLSLHAVFRAFLERETSLKEKYDTNKLELVAQGSTSAIFKTEDRISNRTVALKVLKNKNKQIKDQFDKSAKIAVKLSDIPHFMTIYDLHLDGEYHFYSQQYIPGNNLRKLLRRPNHQFSFEEIRQIVLQVGEALVKMHKLIEHRALKDETLADYLFCNIKPSNIMQNKVTKEIFLSPFNLCLDDEGQRFDREQVIKELEQKKRELEWQSKRHKQDFKETKGSDYEGLFLEELAYLLPERLDKISDCKGTRKLPDIYMLGLLTYELLTGKCPPTFQNFDLLKQNSPAAYTDISSDSIDRSDLPESLKNLVMDIIQRHPEQRKKSYSGCQVGSCELEYVLSMFNKIDCQLNLAQESYKVCVETLGEAFDSDFIDVFLKRLEYWERKQPYYDEWETKKSHNNNEGNKASLRKGARPAHIQLSFKDKKTQEERTIKRKKHAQALNQSILFLFAYFEQDERFQSKQEPNILTQVAHTHRHQHQIESDLYTPFKQALVDTLVELDHRVQTSPETKKDTLYDSNGDRSASIRKAWEHVVQRGFEYMINNGNYVHSRWGQ